MQRPDEYVRAHLRGGPHDGMSAWMPTDTSWPIQVFPTPGRYLLTDGVAEVDGVRYPVAEYVPTA
jgi:hypothetical protein